METAVVNDLKRDLDRGSASLLILLNLLVALHTDDHDIPRVSIQLGVGWTSSWLALLFLLMQNQEAGDGRHLLFPTGLYFVSHFLNVYHKIRGIMRTFFTWIFFQKSECI